MYGVVDVVLGGDQGIGQEDTHDCGEASDQDTEVGCVGAGDQDICRQPTLKGPRLTGLTAEGAVRGVGHTGTYS